MTTTTPPLVVPTGTVLSKGPHQPNGTYCVMELISVLAGERWSDAPRCVAPTLRRYCIALNDQMPDDERQRLLPYVPRLVGTAPESPEVAQTRAYLCADRAVRVFAPLALEAGGRAEDAATLRALAPIVDRETARAGRKAAAYAAADAAAAAAAWDESLRLIDDLLAVTA